MATARMDDKCMVKGRLIATPSNTCFYASIYCSASRIRGSVCEISPDSEHLHCLRHSIERSIDLNHGSCQGTMKWLRATSLIGASNDQIRSVTQDRIEPIEIHWLESFRKKEFDCLIRVIRDLQPNQAENDRGKQCSNRSVTYRLPR